MGKKRSEILNEIENLRQSLLASEKRGKRAVAKARELERVLKAAVPGMKTCLDLPLNPATPVKVLTVGQCRELLVLLEEIDPEQPPSESSSAKPTEVTVQQARSQIKAPVWQARPDSKTDAEVQAYAEALERSRYG